MRKISKNEHLNFFVIIPAYNEARNIRKCINQIRPYCHQIIVVNDGSTDKTGEIIDTIRGIKTIHLEKNWGKGYAMRMGAELAWKLGAEGVIFMDGDNQHHPKHIKEFARELKRGNEIVIGIRLLKAEIPWHRKAGNVLMATLMRKLFMIAIPDIMCGFRAFTKQGYERVSWLSNNYGVETEVITIIGRRKLPFKTVVVDTIYLDKYKGFSIWDGFRIIAQLPNYWWRNL
ncbi:MAG: glycosyltransferase family 2 protein [bacterium]